MIRAPRTILHDLSSRVSRKRERKAHELLIEAQTDLDESFGKLDEMQSLLAAQLADSDFNLLWDIDVTGKYMKFLDQFDSREKPDENSQIGKTLLQVRTTVDELYQNRHEYHKDELKTFMPQ